MGANQTTTPTAAAAAAAAVAVVDDDEAVRDSLAALLEAEGLTALTFAAPVDLLAVLDDRPAAPPHPPIGCVVSDVRMAGMDGLALLERLTARGGPPVVIVTGHGDVAMAVRAVRLGAIEFLEKPFEVGELVAAVRRALHVGAMAADNAARAGRATLRLSTLSPRELEVLRLLVAGRSNKVIAHELGLGLRTVEVHRARVMAKMGARNVMHLVRLAVYAGLDPPLPPDRPGRPR